jgi:hypothetical protein
LANKDYYRTRFSRIGIMDEAGNHSPPAPKELRQNRWNQP